MKRLKKAGFILTAILWLWTQKVCAEETPAVEELLGGQPSAVPMEEDYEKWEKDGSLSDRVNFMKSLGMQKLPKELAMPKIKSRQAEGYPSNWTHGIPSQGEVRTLVFLVEFQDIKGQSDTVTPDYVKDILFGNGTGNYPYETVSGYYERSSFGKLHIDGDVYGWHTLSRERSYYDGIQGKEEMLQEIMDAYDQEIDFSQYDSDQDGCLDGVYIHFAGDNQGWGTDWWSYVTSATSEIIRDNVKINKYALLHEAWPTTVIHETGHLLGLPDYYDYDGTYNQSGEAGGLGYFDMMDHNAGDHNIFSKMLLGWVEPVFVQEDTDINVAAVTSGEAKAYIIDPDRNTNIFSEYYIVEFYKPEGNNQLGPVGDGGVRIYHVDASLTDGIDFKCDNTSTEHKLIKLVESDGKEENGLKTYPIYTSKYYRDGMELGVNGYPSSEFYQGRYSGINIKVENLEGTNASVKIYFTPEDNVKPAFSNQIEQNAVLNQIGQIKDARLYFDTAIFESNNLNNIYVGDAEGNKIPVSAEILNPRLQYPESVDRYNILKLNSEPLNKNCQYSLIVPEGAVKDSFGNENATFSYPFFTGKDAENVIEIDMLENIPDTIPKDCRNIGEACSEQLKNGHILYCRKFRDENYEKMYTLVQEFDAENSLVMENVIQMPSGIDENNKYMNNQVWEIIQLDNEEILMLLQEGYYRFYSGESIGEKIPYPENLILNSVTNMDTVEEYDDCYIKITNSDYRDSIWYTDYMKIYKNGRMEIGKEELEFCFNQEYYDKNFNLNMAAFELYNTNQDKQFAENNYKDTFGYNEYGIPLIRTDRKVFNEPRGVFISSYLSSFSTDWTSAEVYAIKLEEIDQLHNKIMDMKLSQGGILWGKLFKLGEEQGYIAYVPFASKFVTAEAQIIRLDQDFNIKWNTYVSTHEIVTGAYLRDGNIIFISADKWITVPDTDEIQISSEEMFAFTEGAGVAKADRTNRVLTLKAHLTAAALKECVTGDYQKVSIYDSTCKEVNDNTVIDQGLMKVTASNGIYEYYYQIQKTDRIVGDVTGDGSVNLKDLRIVLKGISGGMQLIEEQKLAADVNNDGKITLKDLMILLQYVSGKIDHI